MLQLVSWKHFYPHSEMAFSASYALALVAVFFVQGLSAAQVRRAAEDSTPLQELLDHAKSHLETVSEELSKIVNATSFDEVKAMLESKRNELEDRTKSVLDELKRQYDVHGPEISERASSVINEVTSRLNATLEELKAQTPGAMEGATALHQRIVDSIKTTSEVIFEETGKLAKAAGEDASSIHTALTNLSRDAVTHTTHILEQMHNELKEAVKHITTE